MKDFSTFIEERISAVKNVESNCVATALYLVGERDSYEYLSRGDSRKLLSKMKKSKEPKLGYLVSWESEGIPFHSGVIFREEPFHVIHRNNKERLLIDSPLNEFNEFIFKNLKIEPTYRIPNKFSEEIK